MSTKVPFDNWERTYSDYTPFLSYISNISNAQNAIVTFTATHPYTVGELLGLRVSQPYGMIEVNNMTSQVIATTSLTVTLALDTLTFTPFVYPPVGTVTYPAIAVPAGSGIVPNAIPAQTNILDVFDNAPLN
jgi:hypothetical protein